jgi:thiol-disulfide isomerase/thioredoxin
MRRLARRDARSGGSARRGCRLALLTACAAVSAVALGDIRLQATPFAQGQTGSPNRPIQPTDHPVLKIGSPAPDFSLPGVDGKTHTLRDYASARVLAIVFESNHCPVSMLYENRIKQIYEDYRNRGVAVVAINPNNPRAVRLNEQGYTDVTDSLPAMKIRSAYRHRNWPYLYDGETQATSAKFGAEATPHIFVFDQERKLRYQGHIDDNVNESLVKSKDARIAIDAVLAGKPVPVPETRAFGCTTKWLTKATGVEEEWASIKAEPVRLTMAGADDLKKVRANGTDKILLVNFWSVRCSTCLSQFADLETTYRMYRSRSGRYASLDFVSISTDAPADRGAVLDFLQKQSAGNPNLQFGTADSESLQAAWGAKWNLASSFTVVITPDGKVAYQKEGKLDIYELRRAILRNMPDVVAYPGQHDYWNSVSK